MPNRPVPPEFYGFVSSVEGRKNVVYLDTGGKPTGGVGHTGPDVPAVGTIIDDNQIQAWLVQDSDHAAGILEDALIESRILAFTDHEWMAMLSFAFNLGFNPGWQIAKDINTGLLSDVPAQMIRFDHGLVDGQEVEIAGLKNRRVAEIALWNDPDMVGHAADIIGSTPQPSSGYVRNIITPPRPVPAPPLADHSMVTKIAGGVTGLGVAAQQIQSIVQPHATEAAAFAHIAVGLTGVIILCSVAGLYIDKQQAKARAT